eukprot:733890_1
MGKNPCNYICSNRYCGFTCIAILFLLGLGCIIQLFFVSQAIEDAFYDTINDRIIMSADQQEENTEDYRNWLSNNNSDAPLQLFEFWIYNVTNPHDVVDGDYPVYHLLGPFTFRRFERRSKPGEPDEEPEFFEEEDESTVEYDYIYHFEFIEEWSTDNTSLDDMVWAVSGAMQGLFITINDPLFGLFVPECVHTALGEFPGEAIFYHTPIRNLTYGIKDEWILKLDEYCDAVNDTDWPNLKPNTLYSLLADGTSRVVQHTGKANITKVGELKEYRNWTEPQVNSDKLLQGPLWDHTETVEGSRETRNFPPKNWINKNRELVIWSIEKFRKTKYLFDRDVVYKGVDLMRFRISDEEGKACFNQSANCKYYQFWEDGIWNLTNLRGSPSFLSKGRFLDAPYFINTTNIAFGISMPNYEEDDQYFDIDPKAGIVMRNFHNYQINFLFQDADRDYETNFTNFSIFDRLLPMAYVRVEALATDSQMDFYKNALRVIDIINGFSLYGGPAFAVVFFGLMFFILCKMKRKGAFDFGGDTEDQYGRLVEATPENDGTVAMTSNPNNSYGAT